MSSATTVTEHPGIWRTFRDSPAPVKTMMLGVFVNRLGGFMAIFLVLYARAKGYSIGQATLALGAYGAGSVVGVLIGGTLADRLGARDATVFSMGGMAVFTIALLYLPTYPLLLCTAFLLTVVGQIYRPASATLLSALTPDGSQVMIFAMYRFGLNVGTTLAPLIGYGLYNLGGNTFTLLFWVDALASLAYALLALVALPGPDRSVLEGLRSAVDGLRAMLPGRAARAGAPAAGSGAAAGGGAAPGGQATTAAGADQPSGYAGLLRDRRYVLYLVATFVSVAVYVQYQTTLPLDVQGKGLKIFWYTLAVSLNGFIVIAFELLVTKVSQRWPMRVSISLALVLVACGVAFYGLPLGPAVIIIGTLIWTLGELLGGPATFAYAAVAGPAYLKGRYIGGYQFMFGLGTAIGPIVGGALFTAFGHSAWPIFAGLELVALAFALAGIRSRNAAATAVVSEQMVPTVALPAAPVLLRRRPVRAVPKVSSGARSWVRAPARHDSARAWVRPPDRARDWVRPAVADRLALTASPTSPALPAARGLASAAPVTAGADAGAGRVAGLPAGDRRGVVTVADVIDLLPVDAPASSNGVVSPAQAD